MVDQEGRVVVAATEACCDAEQVLLLGKPERDFLVSRPGPICAFGLEAANMIQGSPRSDFLAGGDDDDMLFANASDVVVGEGGDDTIVFRNSAAHVRLFGGDGRDHTASLRAERCWSGARDRTHWFRRYRWKNSRRGASASLASSW